MPDWGEIVLAELTQTFDNGDASYFFPLMEQIERRLGRKPCFGALDKAYDAFYVYQYFHEAGAIYKQRTADERINSQALALGIERPHLRRPSAIVNQNTLIYVLINLRALQRIRIHQEQRAQQSPAPGRAQPGAAHWTTAAATDRTKLSGTVLFTCPAATNCTLSGPLLA